MRRRILALAALGAAAALLFVQCTSGDDGTVVDLGSDAGDGDATADASADGASAADGSTAPDAHDAGLDAAPKPHCSPDHWCRTPMPTTTMSLFGVWSFGPTDVYAVGNEGMIHFDGTSWSGVDSDTDLENLSVLWASGPGDLWAVAPGQHRLVHGVRGAGGAFTFTAEESDGGPSRDFVTGASGDLFLGGMQDDGTPALEHGAKIDGGAIALSTIAVPTAGFTMTGIYAPSTTELFLSGRVDPHPVVLRAVKGPSQWTFSQSYVALDDFDFPAIWGSAANDVWVIGAKGNNHHRAPLPDGGGAWGEEPNDAKTALAALWGSGPDDVWAVGYLGGVRHWDGKTWTLSQIAVNGNPLYHNLYAVHGSSADDVWAVGDGIALHRTPDGGP